MAVPPAPALPAPSLAPKEALSLGHKQDLVNEPEFGVSVLLTVPVLLCLEGKPQTERSGYFLTLEAKWPLSCGTENYLVSRVCIS